VPEPEFGFDAPDASAWEPHSATISRGVAITLFPFRARFRGLRRLALRLAAQPVAITFEVVDLAVMEEPIDEGGGASASSR